MLVFSSAQLFEQFVFDMAGMSESGKQKFEIACASRGFHVYREIWNPKTGQKLQVNQEINNIHDPFAISLGAKLNGKLTSNEIVGHIPLKISRGSVKDFKSKVIKNKTK